VFAQLSGAYFNPAVSIVLASREMSWPTAAIFIVAQILGAIGGVWMAHLMFDQSPHTPTSSSCSTVAQGRSSGDPVGASCRLRRAEHCRTELGTFSGLFVANCPPSLALPLRLASKTYELQLTGPTFANDWLRPRAISFQGLGAGDGNRTHDIQLGKLSFYH
jgi:hypothetical protein